MQFNDLMLELIHHKLNLMVSEIFQLNSEKCILSCSQTGSDVDFNDIPKLVKIILVEISKNNIQSVHVSQKYAINALKMYDMLCCNTEWTGIGYDCEYDDLKCKRK